MSEILRITDDLCEPAKPRRRVCVVITARPSYSRIKTALMALKSNPGVDLRIVVGASALITRYGRITDQIRADGFDIAAEVPSVIDGDDLRDSVISTGLLAQGLANVFAAQKPDVVVTIADRHETLATAMAASYQHIPLCHIQGGEVTGSIDDKVRNAISQLADVHCVSSPSAFYRVQAMTGSSRVYQTGCPSIDLAEEALRLGPLTGTEPGVVVLQHAVTNEMDQAAQQMQTTIDALQGVWTTYFWPGEDAGNAAMSKVLRLNQCHPTRNLPPVEFLRLLLGAECLVGNSSVGIRECSHLGVPVVNIGTRQKGREFGANVTHVPHDVELIRHAVKVKSGQRYASGHSVYGQGNAGEQIAAVLARPLSSEWRNGVEVA